MYQNTPGKLPTVVGNSSHYGIGKEGKFGKFGMYGHSVQGKCVAHKQSGARTLRCTCGSNVDSAHEVLSPAHGEPGPVTRGTGPRNTL